MPNNDKKIFEYLSKYFNNLNIKQNKVTSKDTATKSLVKSNHLKESTFPSFVGQSLSVLRSKYVKEYVSALVHNAKLKSGVGTHSMITNASRLDIKKLFDDLKINVTLKKQQKIPKWKTHKPAITLEGINVKTKHMLTLVKSATLQSSRLIRLEELLSHLIEYPEAKHFAVKTGAIGVLLEARALTDDKVSDEIIRTLLASLGYADPPRSSGIRILSIDGGGMRGLAVIQMLQKIEEISGRRIYDLFDFICGVSTGAIITCSLIPPNKIPMNRIHELYLELSRKVFNQSAIWGTSKLVWSHAYYDTSLWEKFLMDYVGNLNLIESNKWDSCPKVAVVSTVVNNSKVSPFIFRNYGSPCYKVSDYIGSFRHTMFEAVRASAAAPTMFEEFKTGQMLHQDGGIVVNNPAAIALHEAKSLWPDEEINCIVSVGTGKYDPRHDEEEELAESSKHSTSWKQIFDQILESATDTEGVHRILNDLLPDDTYFRLNPHLSRKVTMDETNMDVLNALQEDTKMYCRRNEDKFHDVAKKLSKPRSYTQKLQDSVILQMRLSGFML